MLSIAICDDDITLCAKLEKMILEYRRNCFHEIEIDIYHTGEALSKFLDQGVDYDLVFLDIELNLLNGVQVGQKIRDELKNENMKIVYMSAKESYAMELFQTRPFHFLVKPFTKEKIFAVIDKILELSQREHEFFEFNIGKTVHRIFLRDIIYFESKGRKVKLITNEDAWEFYGKLTDIEKFLGEKKFLLIHKSYLINFYHIIEQQYETVKMTDERVLSISQQNRALVRKKVMAYRKGGA